MSNLSFSLTSVKLFNSESIIDQIHQLIIDLELKPPKNEIQDLLIESISYLDNELDIQTANELINLIVTCLTRVPDQPDEFYHSIFNDSQKNSNRLILFAKIFSKKLNIFSFPNAKNFIQDILIQITNQIQQPKDVFLIHNIEINPKFLTDFIIDIVLISDLDEKSISIIYPFLFAQKDLTESQIGKLSTKYVKKELINAIPEIVFTNKTFLTKVPHENLNIIITKLTEPTFFKVLPLLCDILSHIFFWSSVVASAILFKCNEFNYDIKNNDKLLSFVKTSLSQVIMKPFVWNYLAKYDIKLPQKVAVKIDKFPCPADALKIMPNIQKVPVNIVIQALLETNDLQIFELVSDFDFVNEKNNQATFSQKNFWIHFFSVISSSFKKYSIQLLNQFTKVFNQFVTKDNLYEIIEAMIFDNFPPTSNGNDFLVDLLNGLNNKEDFFKYEEVLFNKIIKKKVNPLPSFWRLFNYDLIEKYYKENNDKNAVLYALKFSRKSSQSKLIDKIAINPITNEISQKFIIEFIKDNDLNRIGKMDNESLSFVLSVLLCVDVQTDIKIKGLTKKTILPFFAIFLNHLSKEKCKNFLLNQTKFAKILFDACNFLPRSKSLLSIESINAIVSCESLYDFSFLPENFSFQIFNLLINQLIDNIYIADKLILLKAVFKISYQYSTNNDVKILFDKNRNNLLKFIIKNRQNIPNFNTLASVGLCSNIFKLKQTSSLFKDVIENSSVYDEVVNAIWFINNLYLNCPKLNISLFDNLLKIINEGSKIKCLDDLYLLYQFIGKYDAKDKLNKLLSSQTQSLIIQKLATIIMRNQQQEKVIFPYEFLFHILMNDYSIASNYFYVLFEKISSDQKVSPNFFLEKYKNYYESHRLCFINAIRAVFDFNSDVFIRKPCIKRNNPPLSKSVVFMIHALLNEAKKKSGNLQVFILLKNIASSFPFLFENYANQIFSTVKNALGSFVLLFKHRSEKMDENETKELKAALAALSFLSSLLYSVKILEDFVPWILQSIIKFSDSQVLAFSFVLISLFDTPNVNKVMTALSLKFSLADIICKLLIKDVEESINNIYRTNIITILTKFYKILGDMNSTHELVYIDEIRKIKNPFLHTFNNFYTIYPEKLKQLNLPIPDIPELNSFVNEINEVKSFWLEFVQSQPSYCSEVSSFIDEVITKDKSQNSNLKMELIDVPRITVTNQIRFCAKQPIWIYKYIVQRNRFPLNQQNCIKLKNVIKELNSLSNEIEMNLNYDEINVDHFFSYLYQKDSIDSLIKNVLLNGNQNKEQCFLSLINGMIKSSEAFRYFVDTIKNCIDQNPNKVIELITKLEIPNNKEFNIIMINGIGNTLIDLALSPNYRKNLSFMNWLVNLLHFADNLPDRVVFLIFFIIIGQSYSIKLSEICNKISKDACKKVIQFIFDYILDDQSNSFKDNYYPIINEIIKSNPLLIQLNISKASNYIDEAVLLYPKRIFKNEIIDFIFNMFNIIAPKRDEVDLINPQNFSLESQNTNAFLKSAHPDLIQTNPEFWNLYEKHLNLINNIISNKKSYIEKLTFLNDYPELHNFEKRLFEFKKAMNKKIDQSNTLSIDVDRSNILFHSYSFLKNKSRDDWLKNFHVKFVGEYGIDLGGVRKSWFSLIVKELFNPNFALFVLTENKNYQPNPHSEVNEEHIEFFKFAGKIIARAMIQGQCVDAHFTRSFYRQILHSQVHVNDFEDIDESIYKSLQVILNEDVEPLGLNFTIDVDEFGLIKTVPLKENGDEINVTNENKKEYVQLYVDYRLRKSIVNQVDAFCEGFNWLISSDEIRYFSPNELELIICGNKKFDVNDLKANTFFTFPYTASHPVIVLFFNVLSKWSHENLSKFLLFLTGSSQVPIGGFKEYKESGNPITISPGGDRNRLCVAHTCFNILDLPEYKNEDELNKKLLQSIQECRFYIG